MLSAGHSRRHASTLKHQRLARTVLDRGRQAIGRKARKLVKTAATVDGSDMSSEDLTDYAANVYVLSRMGKQARYEGVKQIAATIGTVKQLPSLEQITKMVKAKEGRP